MQVKFEVKEAPKDISRAELITGNIYKAVRVPVGYGSFLGAFVLILSVGDKQIVLSSDGNIYNLSTFDEDLWKFSLIGRGNITISMDQQDSFLGK